MPNIQRIAGLVQEISAATREQSIDTGQIGRAMRDLDAPIRHNATTAQQLAQNAATLDAAIGFFQADRPEALRQAA